MIKCVIWDLDRTLLDGVFLESAPGAPPPADPQLTAVLRELTGRGIVHAVASRNPPAAAEHAAAVTGARFAAVQCGWGAKPEAVRAILADLQIGADAVAFVDDEPIERAEVAAALPEVLVLSPEDARDAPGWPEFSPAVVTDEARRRGEMYAQRRRRQAGAQAFGGSREEFLRRSGTRVVISPARLADAARVAELSQRTHQFNSTGEQLTTAELDGLLRAHDLRIPVVRLSDDYGDDGLVGACLIGTGPAAPGPAAASGPAAGGREWAVPLLMMSCRAMGRGVIDALLAWLCREASGAGAAAVRLPCRLTSRNVPLRLALAAAGFRAGPGDGPGPDGLAVFSRALDGPLPEVPRWARAEGWSGQGE